MRPCNRCVYERMVALAKNGGYKLRAVPKPTEKSPNGVDIFRIKNAGTPEEKPETHFGWLAELPEVCACGT